MRISQSVDPCTLEALEIIALAMEYICEERDKDKSKANDASIAIHFLLGAQKHLFLKVEAELVIGTLKIIKL